MPVTSQHELFCDNLSKKYAFPHQWVALEEVSLDVKAGEIFGLLGPNGAGKTTLVRILCTLLEADSGQATVCGFDVEKQPQKVRDVIGFAGQDSERSGYYRLTSKENLVFFACSMRNVEKPVAIERISEMASWMGFSDKLNRYFGSLSGGEKQLVITMRSLVHDPQVCFLDEPTRSLDPLTAKSMREYLRRYNRTHQTTFFLTTHNLKEAEDMCDRLALIHSGRIRFVGTPNEFRATAVIREAIEVRPPILAEETLQQICSVSGVVEISTGISHRIYCKNALQVLPEVAMIVRHAGAKVSVSMAEPTVEDAFRAMVTNGV
jgi:ABC-2 type transport system ATP-binding protein